MTSTWRNVECRRHMRLSRTPVTVHDHTATIDCLAKHARIVGCCQRISPGGELQPTLKSRRPADIDLRACIGVAAVQLEKIKAKIKHKNHRLNLAQDRASRV